MWRSVLCFYGESLKNLKEQYENDENIIEKLENETTLLSIYFMDSSKDYTQYIFIYDIVPRKKIINI